MPDNTTEATSASKKPAVDIPTRVFEKFLQALADGEASPELIARLRATLLQNKTFTDRALREAIFGEETRP
jgi:hypothetical protein